MLDVISCRYTTMGSCMGWLRLVGSSKLKVSFAKYSLFYRAPLQKRPWILRSLGIVATPYQSAVRPKRNQHSISCYHSSVINVCCHNVICTPQTYIVVIWYVLMTLYKQTPQKNICCHDVIQCGEHPQDALSCRSFVAKEYLTIGLSCGKWPTKIRHPMGLRHPLCVDDIDCMCFYYWKQ